MSTKTTFSEILTEFADSLRDTFSIAIPGQPEDQLKGPVQALAHRGGAALNFEVASKTESRLTEINGRPDIGVSVRKLLCGYIELKAPGKGARIERFKGPDKQQWEKFRALPNVIYTDGSEWALYRSGERSLLVRFDGDVTVAGSKAITPAHAVCLSDMFRDFLTWDPPAPANPQALAQVLAPLCRLLRRDVEGAIANANSNLSILAAEWRAYLFPMRTMPSSPMLTPRHLRMPCF